MCGNFAKMSRKRSQRTALDEGSEATEDGTEAATEAVGDAPSKRKKNGTLKDKILAVVRNSDSLLGLQKIKRLLVEDYGLTENKAFNTNVNKAIKALVEANDENFGKIGGSYHGGVASRAYLLHQEKETKKAVLDSHRREGEILCPYCHNWCSSECFIEEDSVARGGRHRCEHCPKDFWSWISDGYLYGHEVEYRYGDGKSDYA
jgi:hypothetical protein